MKENVGTVDRSLRVVFGIALFFVGWLGDDGALSMVLLVVGLVLIVTGLMSHCPIYSIMGKSTVEEPDPRGH
jgi:sugar phosphate permease